MLEQEQRKRFVDAALAYIGTPYHHHGMIKGAGVDCATLLVCAGQDAELIRDFPMPDYSPQWHLHRSAEKYLATITNVCGEVEGPPRPGDIVLYQFGRAFSHAAIVVDWPVIVHACINDKVRTDDALKASWLTTIGENVFDKGKPRPMKIVSYWKR